MPIIAAARRCTPSRVMTKMLPPVTPSMYDTFATTAGIGIDRSGESSEWTTATLLRSTVDCETTLEHLGHCLAGRVGELDEGLFGGHDRTSARPMTCTARQLPLRPGWARWAGT